MKSVRSQRVYRVRQGSPIGGDYASVLYHGFAVGRDGRAMLRRVGPFVPPFSMPVWRMPEAVPCPYSAIVTDECRESLSMLRDVEYELVECEKVVCRPWESVVLSGKIPMKWFVGGEPESVIDEASGDNTVQLTSSVWCMRLLRNFERHEDAKPAMSVCDIPQIGRHRWVASWIYLNEPARQALQSVLGQWESWFEFEVL